jgi:Uma2 family endonuclease
MSGPQFDALPFEEGRRWELLEGELIAVSSATPKHQLIVINLLLALRQHLLPNLGLVLIDVEFALSEWIRLRPDVCVLLKEKASRLDTDQIPIPGSPDLAVEVISPTERPSESLGKVRSYLRNGASEVWQVYPKTRTVEIHTELGIRVLASTDWISTPLLPGFQVPVAAFFATTNS